MIIVTPEPEVHETCSKFIELPHLVYVYQTVKFPVQSSTGGNYLIVSCDCDANAILEEPMPNRKT